MPKTNSKATSTSASLTLSASPSAAEPASAPTASAAPGDPVESLLSIFFAMLVGIPAVLFILWILGYTRESEVVSSRPIGNFVSMSGPGGLKNSVVIETDTGSYPLLSVPVIVKGTALVLELRGNDQRFVCDASRTLCIKSAREEFTNTPGGNKS